MVVKTEFHSFILSRERRRERAGKVGHDDEEEEEDEEGDGKSCCKIGMFLSFILSPMPAPLLYTEIGVVEMCDAHSVFLELPSLTEDMRAT